MVDSIQRRVVSLGGGKGGVGKSVVAANLAIAMAQVGARVVLVDADLGSANQHTLFGISRPGPGLQAFLRGEAEDLAEVAVETGVPRLTLVPGSAGVVGDANLPFARKLKLVRHVRALAADVVIVDVGAGVSFNNLDLFDMADLRLVVLTPQLTAVQNAYGFLKGAVFRELRRIASATGRQSLIDEAEEGEAPTSTTAQLLARLATADPALARDLQAGLAHFGARLLGNQLFKPNEVNVIYAMSRMARDFLGLTAPVVGSLRASRLLHESVNECRPYLLNEGAAGDGNAAVFRSVADSLLSTPLLSVSAEILPGPDQEGKPSESESLPADVAAYQRAGDRLTVTLPATLVYPGGLVSVLLRDVSEGGALLEVDNPPPVGTRVTLILSRLSEPPRVPCLVKHVARNERRAGVEFQADPRTGERLLELIRKAAEENS